MKTAQTITDTFRLAQAARFNLYMIDNHFPDGTGAELCRMIHRFYPDTPLIIYSGTSAREDLEEGLRAGAQAYILKPYIEELLQAIATLLTTRGRGCRCMSKHVSSLRAPSRQAGLARMWQLQRQVRLRSSALRAGRTMRITAPASSTSPR